MRKIPLTQGQVAIVDDDDYVTLSQYKWYALWDDDTQSFYAGREFRINGKRRTVRMQAFLMGGMADHKNHDTLDNQRDNLRIADRFRNAHNRRISRNNTSGYKGVSPQNGRWRAVIYLHSKRKSLGMFDDPIDAAKAYDAAARELFGEFAYLNFPETKK